MYQDNDDISQLGERMLKELMDKGNASISLNDLWEGTGFIRADQIENIDQITQDPIDDDDEIADPIIHLMQNGYKMKDLYKAIDNPNNIIAEEDPK